MPSSSDTPFRFAAADPAAIPLHLIGEQDLDSWVRTQPTEVADWVRRIGFTGALGQTHLVPAGGGSLAITGFGTPEKRARGRFALGHAAAALPKGTYALATDLPPEDAAEQALAWLLSAYRFTRYKQAAPQAARLVAPQGIDAGRIERIAEGEGLTRDLINTPAADMGPAEIEAAARALADSFGATLTTTIGPELETGFPLVHAVGRASPRAPRLIRLSHAPEHLATAPLVSLVGKGVAFDTGGLNLKPGNSMALMKKDMGGAATVLGLAHMILALELPVRLHVVIPAVENSVSGDSFRPGDILTARSGTTVEINNTDAEGRLVLADALTVAREAKPDLMVSMATLTGAARVAVGPDLAPFYTDDEAIAAALGAAGRAVADPVWRLPFHAPYETMIEPQVAQLDNAPSGGFAGSITAALFLRRFACPTPGAGPRYIHFDIYGWQPSAAPARPKGGVGQGARALLQALPDILGL